MDDEEVKLVPDSAADLSPSTLISLAGMTLDGDPAQSAAYSNLAIAKMLWGAFAEMANLGNPK